MDELTIRKHAVSELSPILEPHRFEFVRHGTAWDFVRDTESGFQQIQLLATLYGDNLEFGIAGMVGVNAINQVMHQFIGVMPDDLGRAPTFGVSLAYFGIQNGRFKIDSDLSLTDALEALKKPLLIGLIPFMDKYSSVSELDKELNRNDRPTNIWVHDVNQRPYIGITAAALNKNPQFSHWEKFYRDKIKKQVDVRRQQFERLAQYIKENVLC